MSFIGAMLGTLGAGVGLGLANKIFGGGGRSGGTDPRYWERYSELSKKAEALLDGNRPIMINGFPVYPRGPQRQAAAYMGLAPAPAGGGYSRPGLTDYLMRTFGTQFGSLAGKGLAGGIANTIFPQSSPADLSGTQVVDDLLVMPEVEMAGSAPLIIGSL